MQIRSLLFVCVILAWVGRSVAHERHPNPAFAPTTDVPTLPRVLLIGDSISIGYTRFVREQLEGIANVHRAPENCGPTTRGKQRIQKWIGDRTWDVVHFNFGLHDLKYVDPKGKRVDPDQGKIQVSAEDYRRNLTDIVQRLRTTRAQLIWCTTTPVPLGAHGRIPGDEIGYNEVALEVIREESASGRILVNDLWAFANEEIDEIQKPADVHFTPDGSRQLATHVVTFIKEALEIKGREPKMATGIVFHDSNGNGERDAFEKPLSGIKVSNGREITRSDQYGRYQLSVADDTVLFVIKPRGWRTPVAANQLPHFFYLHKPAGSPPTKYEGVPPTGALPVSVDFPLYTQDEPEQFKAILFGDPQPRDQKEVDYIAHDVVEELIGTDASFGVTLGDIVHDDLTLFEPQARAIAVLGIPWYNVIGNHDLNFDAPNDKLSDESFERMFGPSYYSFDYGPVHFLVLDDVQWHVEPSTVDQDGVEQKGEGSYRGGLGGDQMEFIRNDLAAIPEDQLVVLLMHIPLVDVHDRQQLYRLIEQRPFCMSVSAHKHVHRHRFITREDGWQGPEPHHHVIHVTVSGSWWQGQPDERGIPHATMADGAPNGYSIVSFDGQEYRLDFKAAGRSADYQMNIHAPESVDLQQIADAKVLVNVFNGSAKSKVELRWQEENDWTRMEYVQVEDPAFRKIFDAELEIRNKLFSEGGSSEPTWRKLNAPARSTHIWTAAMPPVVSTGVHVLQVRATDLHGRIDRDQRLVRVETSILP